MAEPGPDEPVNWVRYRSEDGDSYAVWAPAITATGDAEAVERTLKTLILELWGTVRAIRISEERRLHGAQAHSTPQKPAGRDRPS